jgi:hypothetical protein
MKPAPKTRPFDSDYLRDFFVADFRLGDEVHYPHYAQLPKLWRALNMEYTTFLPPRISRADHRASDLVKIMRSISTDYFCGAFNGKRSDGIVVVCLHDRNLVAQIAIVQHIQRSTNMGTVNSFKFFAGDDFFQEVYLNNRRLLFADHLLQRFSERTPAFIGTTAGDLLGVLFNFPSVGMMCNGTPAFVYPHLDSIIALPVRLVGQDYFFPTCLSINEINTLEPIYPPPTFTLHYDPHCDAPKNFSWDPVDWALDNYDDWKKQKQPQPKDLEHGDSFKFRWARHAAAIKDVTASMGYGENSSLVFQNEIPGPTILKFKNKSNIKRLTMDDYMKRHFPDYDAGQHVDLDSLYPVFQINDKALAE